jgi:hypothetical protein
MASKQLRKIIGKRNEDAARQRTYVEGFFESRKRIRAKCAKEARPSHKHLIRMLMMFFAYADSIPDEPFANPFPPFDFDANHGK